MTQLTSLHTAFGITLGILLGITASSVIAWNNPTDTPPDSTVAAPLTTGGWQTKLEGLVLNNSDTPTALGLLVANGNVEVANGKIASLSTQTTDPGNTVVTKDYVDAQGGGAAHLISA
jgi:hypothetical protein